MGQKFEVTAQLNLRAPRNLKQVASQIHKTIGGVNGNVNLKINSRSAGQLDTLNKRFGVLRTHLKAIPAEANRASQAVNNLASSFQKFNTQSQNVSIGVRAVNSNVAQGTKQVQKYGNEMEKFGAQAALAARRFAAFAVPVGILLGLVAAIKGGVKEAIDFQHVNVRIAQVAGKTTGELKELNSQIGSLAKGLGTSSKDLQDTAQTLVQAGLSARDTKVALESLAKTTLAPTFDNIKNTTEGAIAIFGQFGTSAKDLERQLGSINTVAARYAVESSDLITVIRKSGGAFKQAGGNLNELLGLFTAVRSTTRESADSIATAFRTIFSRLQRPDTIAKLESLLKINLSNNGQFVGPVKAIQQLNQALSQLPDGNLLKAAIAEEVGGIRQIGKTIPLINQYALAIEAINVAHQGETSLAKDAAAAQESLAVQLTRVKERFLDLFRAIAGSNTFKVLTTTLLNLSHALLAVSENLVPLLPALTAISVVRGATAAGSLGKAFFSRVGKGFSSGGLVPGHGSGDTVPARLEPGEVVIRKQAVQKYGKGFFLGLNNGGSRGANIGGIQHFKDGGEAEDIKVRDHASRNAKRRTQARQRRTAEKIEISISVDTPQPTQRAMERIADQLSGGYSVAPAGAYSTPRAKRNLPSFGTNQPQGYGLLPSGTAMVPPSEFTPLDQYRIAPPAGYVPHALAAQPETYGVKPAFYENHRLAALTQRYVPGKRPKGYRLAKRDPNRPAFAFGPDADVTPGEGYDLASTAKSVPFSRAERGQFLRQLAADPYTYDPDALTKSGITVAQLHQRRSKRRTATRQQRIADIVDRGRGGLLARLATGNAIGRGTVTGGFGADFDLADANSLALPQIAQPFGATHLPTFRGVLRGIQGRGAGLTGRIGSGIASSARYVRGNAGRIGLAAGAFALSETGQDLITKAIDEKGKSVGAGALSGAAGGAALGSLFGPVGTAIGGIAGAAAGAVSGLFEFEKALKDKRLSESVAQIEKSTADLADALNASGGKLTGNVSGKATGFFGAETSFRTTLEKNRLENPYSVRGLATDAGRAISDTYHGLKGLSIFGGNGFSAGYDRQQSLRTMAEQKTAAEEELKLYSQGQDQKQALRNSLLKSSTKAGDFANSELGQSFIFSEASRRAAQQRANITSGPNARSLLPGESANILQKFTEQVTAEQTALEKLSLARKEELGLIEDINGQLDRQITNLNNFNQSLKDFGTNSEAARQAQDISLSAGNGGQVGFRRVGLSAGLANFGAGGFANSIGELTRNVSGFSGIGSKLSEGNTAFTALQNALPDIVNDKSINNPNGFDAFETKIRETLQKAGLGSHTDTYKNVLQTVQSLKGDPEALANATGTESDFKLSKNPKDVLDLLFASLDKLRASAEDTAKGVEDQGNKLVEGLGRYYAAAQQIRESQGQADQIRLSGVRFLAERRSRALGGDVTSHAGPGIAEAFFGRGQARLTGNANLTPDQILAQAIHARRTQQAIGADIQANGDITGEKGGRFRAFEDQVNKSVQALKNLADASSRNAALQERLNALDKDADSRLGLAERFFSSDAEGRAQIEKEAQAAIKAVQAGSLDALSIQEQQQATAFLSSARDVRLFGGEKTGGDLLKQLIGVSGNGVFNQTGKDAAEARGLEGQIAKNIQTAAEAQDNLTKFLQDSQGEFFHSLSDNQRQFLQALGTTIATGQPADFNFKPAPHEPVGVPQLDVPQAQAAPQVNANDNFLDLSGVPKAAKRDGGRLLRRKASDQRRDMLKARRNASILSRQLSPGGKFSKLKGDALLQKQNELAIEAAKARGASPETIQQMQKNQAGNAANLHLGASIDRGHANGSPVKVDFSQFQTAADTVKGPLSNFAQQAEGLAKSINAIPHSIELTGTHKVEVVINGAEMLAKLSPEILKMVDEAARQTVQSQIRKALPEVGIV